MQNLQKLQKENRLLEHFDINDNLNKKYINEQFIKYHQENLKQPDITELQKQFNNEKLIFCNKKSNSTRKNNL